MGLGDSFTGGELPGEPEGHREGDEAGAPQRGWLAPEDRLWRHPSEVGRRRMPPTLPPLFDSRHERRQRRRARRASLAAGVMGAAALATLAAVVLSAFDSESTSTTAGGGATRTPKAAATTVMTTGVSTVIGSDLMQVVDSVRPSLVGLEPTGSQKPARMTGVVLPGGALVVTAAAAIAGRSQLDVVTADGKRRRGTVVGSDAHAGVAVIATAGGLSPATFADETVQPDDLVVAACLCTGTATSPSPETPAAAAVGMVRQVGTGVSLDGGPPLVNAIEAETPLGPMSWGGVLLDGRGRVIGILDGRTSAGSDTLGIFVPSPLAEGVAMELATTHRVEHGWLGVVCTDGDATGATIASILPGSPAVGAGIVPGDVVVAVGAHQVTSVADLQERLYTVAPGSAVQLVVEHGSTSTVMTVKLAATPDP